MLFFSDEAVPFELKDDNPLVLTKGKILINNLISHEKLQNENVGKGFRSIFENSVVDPSILYTDPDLDLSFFEIYKKKLM